MVTPLPSLKRHVHLKPVNVNLLEKGCLQMLFSILRCNLSRLDWALKPMTLVFISEDKDRTVDTEEKAV